MLKELINLANNLDQNGFTKEADYLDSIIVKASTNSKFIMLTPVTDLEDNLYLYELVVSQATKIKGSGIQRAEISNSFFDSKTEFINFADRHGANFPIELSKLAGEKGYEVITTRTFKNPGKKTHTIFFDRLSNGQKIKSSHTPLAGVREGEKPDGTHKSDDQVYAALKEILE